MGDMASLVGFSLMSSKAARMRNESVVTPGAVPNIDDSLGAKLLPSILSITAGTVDVISFLGLGGLFTAHITGNLVIFAARVATTRSTPLAPILAVPVFIAVLGLTRTATMSLQASGRSSLKPLLMLQFLLLLGFLALCGEKGSGLNPDSAVALLGGMLGIAAMAVQNVLVQSSLKGSPATSVMTTNITLIIIDLSAMLYWRDPRRVAPARTRAKHTLPAIVGFAAGCSIGAVCEAAIGLRALILPAGFALLALMLGLSVKAAGSEDR
jgi:uncharacterized membrane protein YoaK (UPF0700 family)